MQVRSKADIQSVSVRLPRFEPIFLAGLEVVVNGTVELAPNSINISSFESCDWVGSAINDPSVKATDRFIEFDLSCVAFVFHHGLTPTVYTREMRMTLVS